MELQQAYIAYEVFSTQVGSLNFNSFLFIFYVNNFVLQNQVCEEYNINPLDLLTSRIAAANKV